MGKGPARRSRHDAESIREQALAWGLPADAFQAADEDDSDELDDAFEVLHENRDALLVFLACETQWQRDIPAMANREIWRGLPYGAVQAVIAMRGLNRHQCAIFDDVQAMERAALPILNAA